MTDLERSRIGFVVGLAAEARLLRRSGFPVEIGGGDPPGAARAARLLLDRRVKALVSFGLCGGLNPGLRPGAILIPEFVTEDGARFACDAGLAAMLGGANCHSLTASGRIAVTAEEKTLLFKATAADAVDLESGAVAQAAASRGLPFAVLRAVADPAGRSLPPAALIALDTGGGIRLPAVLASVLRQPRQIPALIAIGQDAAKARAALIRQVRRIS